MPPSLHLYLRELTRPWKLITGVVGTGLMVIGSFYYTICDWDVGISLLMCSLTWLTAPWALHVLLSRQWRWWAPALLCCWFTVDGVYWLYHTLVGNEMLRWENARVSTPLYWVMGGVWLYRGSLRDLQAELALLWRRGGRQGDSAG